MGYIGKLPATQGKDAGPALKIDDISSDFDGLTSVFSLAVNGTLITPHVNNISVYLSGVYQIPGNSYSLSGSYIVFTGAPSSSLDFHGAILGASRLFIPDNATVETSAFTTDTITSISGSRDAASISGSFGNQRVGTTDDVQFNHITASGNISASGIVIADTFQSTGGSVDGISFTDDLNITGNITASGAISASGNIFGTGNLDIDGTSNLEGDVTLQSDLTVVDINVSGNITGSVVSASVSKFTTATIDKIGGAINFNDENMTNVDIDSGNIDTVTFGSTVQSMISGSLDAASISGSRDAASISGSRDAASISGSRDAASISGSLGANAGVIRTLSAVTVSGSRDAASISGSFGNQRVGTTDDVKFANITGSNDISASGNLSITGNVDIDGTSNFAGDVTLQNDLVVTGRLTAEEIHTTFISSSITQATGSNIFGDATSDSHQFTGSIDVSGSFTLRDGDMVVSDTLTATNIGAFTAAGAIDFNNENMTNVDIDSGVITGITDLVVADGGTGVSTLTDGGVLLGNGAGVIQAMAVLTDGQMIVGDGTTDPVAESGATLRTSIGVGTTDNVLFANITGSNVSASVGKFTTATINNITGNTTSSGNLGADGDLYVGGRITGSSGATFVGNVGIGITAPVTNLHISEGTAGGETLGLTIENSDTSTSTDETVGLSFRHRGRIAGKIVSHRLDEYDNSGEASAGLKFFGVNSESYNLGLAIDHAGKVGIGTAAPTKLLHVQSADGSVGDNTSVAKFVNLESTSGRSKGVDIQAGTANGDYMLSMDDQAGNTKFRFCGDGKVGIGISAPAYAVDILNSTTPQLNISNVTTDNTVKVAQITCAHYDNEDKPMTMMEGRVDGTNNYVRLGGGRTEGTSMNIMEWYFGTGISHDGGVKRSSFDKDDVYFLQNVGIGIAAPTAKLHVHDTTETGLKLTSTDSDFRIYADEGKDALAIVNTGDAVRFSLSGSGKFGFGKIPAGGHPNYAFYFSGSGMTANGSTGGALVETEHYGQPVMEVKGTSAQSNDAFGLRVQASNGTAWIQQLLDSAGNERFRFTGAGIFHTGGVFAAGNNAKAIDATAIESSRDSTSARTHMAFYNEDASNKGTITTSGDSTAFNTSSDYRWKENEITISDGLTRLNQLKPYRFNFKRFPDETLDGFFAHEVQSIVPHAVQGVKDEVDDDGKEIIQTLDHSKLVPLLVASVQELSEKVEEQAKRIEELEN